MSFGLGRVAIAIVPLHRRSVAPDDLHRVRGALIIHVIVTPYAVSASARMDDVCLATSEDRTGNQDLSLSSPLSLSRDKLLLTEDRSSRVQYAFVAGRYRFA